MQRAFRYDGSDMEQQINAVDTTQTRAVSFLKNYNNISTTENGAAGYRTTTHALVDLNFKVASLRARCAREIMEDFIKAFYESPKYAVKWLFFLRDIQEGMGERRSFRICLKYLAISQPKIARAVLKYVPQYGRYDDLLVLLDTPLAEKVATLYRKQLQRDLEAMKSGESISLLAKWLPSNNTSSAESRRYAGILRKYFKMSPKQYRHTLSELRSYSKVVETQISASEWGTVDYARVPAKANLRYDHAFARHDYDRRAEYLEKVLLGESKLQSKGLMPYEIVHRYVEKSRFLSDALQEDLLAELMWKKMIAEGFQNEWGIDNAIVVADGSGSMYTNVSGSSKVQAIEVCYSLAIYFAEQLKGVFHNKAITFSGRPQFIDMKGDTKLKDKLEILCAYAEVANTNIEAVFDLLLQMAVSNEVPAEELPGQVLLISDMEFDSATEPNYWEQRYLHREWKPADEALFTVIRKKYEAAGYRMPRLIFWNVCGRTDTIPMVDNAEGLCLLSGFSQNAMKIAADREKKDPWEALKKVLDSPRYQPIGQAIERIDAQENLAG